MVTVVATHYQLLLLEHMGEEWNGVEDSFVQMALQLAYLRLHGSLSQHNPASPKPLPLPQQTSERREKLMKAIKRHNQLRERCEANQGVDRHLLGLYLVAMEEGEEVPEIFTDPAFCRSIVGYTDSYGGVAAMTPDGYGCFYSIQQDRISFIVTSFVASQESNGRAFTAAVTQSLREMWELVATLRSSL
ncbi:peroxisomal carnitine O-octanoyltransferase-like [Scylla paramamosain]|uniref:peroxisomal carnitine O-octanoyltransferase-like n=1 Tax=Scylla paramamosain TaxID=85552 RepID=UPI00308384F3